LKMIMMTCIHKTICLRLKMQFQIVHEPKLLIKTINNPSIKITCNSSTRAISYVNLFDPPIVDFFIMSNYFWKHLKVNQQFECMTHNNIQIGEHIHYAPYSPYGSSCHVIWNIVDVFWRCIFKGPCLK
jgi:hypothetical protein